MALQAELQDVIVAIASLACACTLGSIGNVTSHASSSACWSSCRFLHLRPHAALHGAEVAAFAIAIVVKDKVIALCRVVAPVFFVMVPDRFFVSPVLRMLRQRVRSECC